MHRFIRMILRLVIQHNHIERVLSQWEWYKHLCYEEAQAVIGNRSWK